VGELRRLLGDRRGEVRYIETIPKRGYRLLAPVRPLEVPETVAADEEGRPDPDPAPEGADRHAPPGGRYRRHAEERSLGGRAVALGAAALLLAFLLVAARWQAGQAAPVTAGSVAILPFTVGSGAPEAAYLGDGIAREVLSLLARLPGVRVASSNSSFQFRDRRGALNELRRSLGVAAVVDGALALDGDRVRVQVQLVDTGDGFTLWAETYERRLGDLFALQGEIARQIADRLSVDLVDPELLTARGSTADVAAYQDYLRARHALAGAATESELRAPLALLETALARDPDFGLARVGLAEVWMRLGDRAFEPAARSYAAAREQIERALATAPRLAEAHWLLGWMRLYHDWDWSGAEEALRFARSLEPGNADILAANAAVNYHLGRLGRAVTLAREAAELDPLRAASFYNLAYFAFAAGDLATSEEALRRTSELAPNHTGVGLLLAQIRLARGDIGEADRAAESEAHPVLRLMGRALVAAARLDTTAAEAARAQLEQEHGDAAAYQIAGIYAALGDRDAAFRWLHRARDVRDPGLAELMVDPLLRPLREDARFAALAAELGLGTA
jgi:TolB-like protein/Tfp pilus assembly protein PilF